MIFDPAIITLVLLSLLTAGFSVYASTLGYRILQYWDIESGSGRQLTLERQTYLVSSVLNHLFAIGILSIFFFIYTVDRIHPLFIGAMCAAGALNVNQYGYPTLFIKIAAVILSGLWLILNHTDNRCPDYPLIRTKYRLLMAVAAVSVLDAYLLVQYFLHMKTDVITACCGIIFNEDAAAVSGKIAAMPSMPAKVLFYLCMALVVGSGLRFRRTGRMAKTFSFFSILAFLVSLASIISFISLYFYELPTHHCPFCLLQKEYHYIGYPLYISLFTACITGLGVGVLEQVGGPESLEKPLTTVQQALCCTAMTGFLIFTVIATAPMLFSDFTLEGY